MGYDLHGRPQAFLNLRGDLRLLLHEVYPRKPGPCHYVSLRGLARRLNDERDRASLIFSEALRVFVKSRTFLHVLDATALWEQYQV